MARTPMIITGNYIGNRLAALQAITNILFFGLPKTASLKFLRHYSIDQIDRP